MAHVSRSGAVIAMLLGVLPAHAVGIVRIAATERGLRVALEASVRGAVRLVELRPFQEYQPDAGLPVVWEGEVAGIPIEIPRFDGVRDRLYSMFQLVDQRGAAIGAPHYVTDLSGLPARDFELPWPKSIKGLQVQMVDDAIALGVKYAGWNVMIPAIIDWTGASQEKREVDGQTFAINMGYIRQLDETVKRLTDAGINVTAILNNGVPTAPDPNNPLIHPNTDLAHAPFHLGAINTTDERGLRCYRAAIEYLAERYSRPGAPYGWITGYIVGNEVQAHWEWYNIGRMPLHEFVKHYGIALRVTDLALRRFHRGLRTYVSMDHHWTATHREDSLMSFGGKEFLEHLTAWSQAGGDFPWQVAFHPYPENLGEPRFWNDRLAPLSFEAPKITFRNLEVLPAFLRQGSLLYEGEPRRIILSEQGFHTPPTPDGEEVQAAAYAYAYYKVSHLPGIDAFILHRHVDHKQEGGLRLGLWTCKQEDPSPCTPDRKKRSYEVFRLADSDQWEEAFAFAKPIVGIQRWEEALPSQAIEQTADLTPALTIVRDGVSPYRIVVPDRPSPVVEYAATELRHFLHQMTGAELPIVKEGEGPALLVGRSERVRAMGLEEELGRLREDGVFIKTVGDDVVLLGQNDRGQLYSVYHLLERYLGVRFLARDKTVIPRRAHLTLPRIAQAYSPPFMYRETLYFDSFPREIAARQRLNGPNSQCDESTGGKIDIYPYVHSFARLVPPEDYFDEHPEYFSLVKGERTRATVHGQLCLTNPDVLRIATEQVLRWIEELPQVPIFDVSQNDGEGACECEKCAAVVEQEGSQHGPILRFVNAIADVVAQKHPGRWIETLAYAYSAKPPALERPRDNVIIRLCHAGCYFHGFERCGLGARLTDYLEQWSRLTRRIFIWHYATNFAHYLAPNQNLAALAQDIKYYAAHGVNGLMVQADYQSPGGELAELRQYLAAQLMWDPARDPEAIRVEFCNGYYGPAAKDVLDYLALLDQVARDPQVHAFGAWDPQSTVSPELVGRGLEILQRARVRTQTPEIQQRVARLMVPLWYMQLAYPERYGLTLEDGGSVLLEFKTVAQASGITHVREGGPSLAGWLAEMEARYGKTPGSLVYDLYLNLWEARRENCLDWRPETIQQEGRVLPGVFHHPPLQGAGDATYRIALPDLQPGQRLLFRFATGFTGPTADGVRFAVLVEGGEIWHRVQAERTPAAHELDLSRWAGRTVRLTLRVSALANADYDWAIWVRPQVVVGKR